MTAAIVRAGVGAYLGEPASADRSIRFGIRRFGSMLLVTILVVATLGALVIPFAILIAILAAQGDDGAGLFATICLGIAAVVVILIAAIRLSLVPQTVVAEGRRGREALRRSWGLTARRFWKVLGVTPGAVTPLAIVNDGGQRVTHVLDAKLVAHELVNCHPLENTATTQLATQDLLRFIRACGHEPIVMALSEAD